MFEPVKAVLCRWYRSLLTVIRSRRSMHRMSVEFYDDVSSRPVYLWVDSDQRYWLAESRYGYRTETTCEPEDVYDPS